MLRKLSSYTGAVGFLPIVLPLPRLFCWLFLSSLLFTLHVFFLSFSLACAHRQWSGTRTARDAPRLSTAAKAATRTFTPIRPENVRQDSYPEKFGRVYSIRVRIGKVDAVLSPLSRFCRHRFDGYGDRALVTRFTFNWHLIDHTWT